MPFPFIALILFAASTILGELLRPKQPQQKRPTLDEFQINTADRNRSISVLWGRQEIKGGNIIAYGDYENTPIIKKTANLMTFGLTQIKQTLGYRHYIGFALALCYGTVDKFYRIKFGEKTAWANEAGQTPTGTQVVSAPQMYGGDDGASGGRGGVYSTVEFYPGSRTQAASSYLRSLDSLHSAYRGVSYLVWRGPSAGGSISSTNKTGTIKSGYVGNQNSIDSVTVEAERCPKALSGANPWYRIGSGDANPVECLYELLTNSEWGLGRSSGYGSSWAAAAHTVYDEGLGFSVLWDSSKSIKTMAQEILDQLGGIIITDNATGNWEIKLARADYNVATIPTLEAVAPGGSVTGYNCIVDVQDYSCGAYDETTGAVKVTFNERLTDKNYQPGTAFVYDKANVSIQGQPITVTINYPGVTDYGVALKLAWRELIARSIPLKKCKIITDTNGARFKPGDVFKLSWPDYRVNQVVFRVLQIGKPKISEGTVELTVVQDVFSVGATVFSAPPVGSWIDPISQPTAVSVSKIIEQPRFASGDKRNVWSMAQKPTGNTNYDLYGSEDNGSSYSMRADGVEFTPVGTLVSAVARGTSAIDATGAFVIAPVAGMSALEAASAAEVGTGVNVFLIEGQDEILAYESFTIDGSGNYVLSNVWRGLLDTVPADHALGAKVWFMHYGAGNPAVSPLGNTFAFKMKMVTRSPKGELAIGSAPVISQTLVDRYLKPYPPANMALADTSVVTSGTVVFADNFNDNTLTGWVTSGGGALGTVTETSQRLEVVANAGAGTTWYARSSGFTNPTGADCQTEVFNINSTNAGQQVQFMLGESGFSNYFIMYVENGTLFYGTNSATNSVAYNATSHRWWRMKFTGSTTVGFYTSPDGSTWTQQGSNVTHALALNSKCTFCRCTSIAGNATTGHFDNVSLIVPGAPSASGSLITSWNERNRLTQTTVLAQNATGVTPEASTTYTLRFYNQSNTLMRTVTGVTGTSHTYSASTELSDNGGTALATTIRVELEAVRSGVTSFQTQKITKVR